MSDLFLILAPLLVLVVVLFLGFVGCDIIWDLDPVKPTPLTFRLQVVFPLKVVGDVTFTYLRPGQMMPDTEKATALGNNSFVLLFHEREVGSWMVNCEMTGELDGNQEHKISPTGQFDMLDSGNWVYTFVASATPGGTSLFDIKLGPGLEPH